MAPAFIAFFLAILLQGSEVASPIGEAPLAQSTATAVDEASSSPESSGTADRAAPGSNGSDAISSAEGSTPDLGRGTAIAITGMAIVAFALILIIGFISALPHALASLEKYFPEKEDPHVRKKSHPESQVPDDEAVLAAIGYVLHSRIQQKQ